MDLVTGCQGSQHLWVSGRAHGVDPARAVLELELSRARDALVVGRLLLRLDLTPTADGAAEIHALTLVVPQADAALGEALVLRGSLRDANGVEARSERRLRLAWGPEGCPGHG